MEKVSSLSNSAAWGGMTTPLSHHWVSSFSGVVQRLRNSSPVHKKYKALSELCGSHSIRRGEIEIKRVCVNGSLFLSELFGKLKKSFITDTFPVKC